MASEEEPVLSYARGDFGDEVFPDKTNFAYVDQWASMWPDNEAYVFRLSETERDAITYGDLKTATENLAVWFKREYKLKKGERVGILSLNRLSYVLCDLALSRLGAVSVRLYVTIDSKAQLIRNLEATDCRLFLCQYASLSSVGAILPLESIAPGQRLMSSELPKLEHVICMSGETIPGTTPLPDWRSVQVGDEEKRELYRIQSGITLDDDCSIYLTSGSTGLPKFVVHSHAGVLSWPTAITRKADIRPTDRYFSDRPLAHLGGNGMSVTTVGATMVIANPWKTMADNPSEYLLTIMKEEDVNCGLSFPYILYDIVKSGSASEEFKKIDAKFFIFAGQLANAEIIGVVMEKLRAPIINAYGSTEMGEVCCTFPSDPLEIVAKYSGQVVAGTEVKIVDPESREIVPRGVIGAIAIRPDHKWYYLNDEARMRASHDEAGFFYQGDMARMADNGYIEIMGREDDMMSVGTVKVYPGPIETMLCRHPAVDKAIVFGVPDPRLYEVIGAVVLPKPGVEISGEEIIRYFQYSIDDDLTTSSTFVPRFVWVERSFPVTMSGKVDKKTLREQCLQKLAETHGSLVRLD